MANRNPYAEYVPPASGGGNYLKFEDNKQVRVHIVSDPVIFDSIYKGNVSTKYAWLVFNIDEKEVQIMQLPKGGYRSLAAVAADEDFGNPMENNYFVKITRTGKDFQTKYGVVPMSNKVTLDEDTKAAIEEIDLVERLSANDNNENVAWLFDEIDGKRTQNEVKGKQEDEVHEVPDGDEPFNLDDLPL